MELESRTKPPPHHLTTSPTTSPHHLTDHLTDRREDREGASSVEPPSASAKNVEPPSCPRDERRASERLRDERRASERLRDERRASERLRDESLCLDSKSQPREFLIASRRRRKRGRRSSMCGTLRLQQQEQPNVEQMTTLHTSSPSNLHSGLHQATHTNHQRTPAEIKTNTPHYLLVRTYMELEP